jgi:hypothetical protein
MKRFLDAIFVPFEPNLLGRWGMTAMLILLLFIFLIPLFT